MSSSENNVEIPSQMIDTKFKVGDFVSIPKLNLVGIVTHKWATMNVKSGKVADIEYRVRTGTDKDRNRRVYSEKDLAYDPQLYSNIWAYLDDINSKETKAAKKEDDCMEGKWFKAWYSDKQMILSAMYENLSADLAAGYDPFGDSITSQRKHIDVYIKELDADMKKLQDKDTKQKVERWCYYDLKRRGAIE